jgi:hypothetical protein
MFSMSRICQEFGMYAEDNVIVRNRLRRAWQTGAIWQVFAAAGLLTFFRFYAVPSQPRFLVCGFHWVTGRPCPLCGMTRAMSSLAKGNWAEAIHFNALSPLVMFMLCGALLLGLAEVGGFKPERRVIPVFLEKNFWTGCILLFVGYGVVRFFST